MALRLQARVPIASSMRGLREIAMLRKLIVFAVTGGLARKSWKQARKLPPCLPVPPTEVIVRPVASADPAERPATRRLGARRRRQGPNG
jgi:hypothetical protein